MEELSKREQLGIAVRREREARRLSQRQLAEMARTTQTEISHIEAGSVDFGVGLLFRLSKALGISAGELFNF